VPTLVCDGAILSCSMGLGAGQLLVPPSVRASGDKKPFAVITDHVPQLNLPGFAVCRSPANPSVAAATAAAQGALTPMPCIPATSSPWAPGSAAGSIDGVPALTSISTCMCQYAGLIQIVNPACTVRAEL
jgi:hypothetical protein